MKKNPLKNLQVMLRLNPYAKTFRRIQLLKQLKKAGVEVKKTPKPEAKKVDTKKKVEKKTTKKDGKKEAKKAK